MGWRAFAVFFVLVVGGILRALALFLNEINFAEYDTSYTPQGSTAILGFNPAGLIPYVLALGFAVWIFFFQNDNRARTATFLAALFLVFLPLAMVLLLMMVQGPEGEMTAGEMSFWQFFPFLQIISSALVFWYFFTRIRRG